MALKLSEFNPATDIPDLSEKVIIVTGGTSGLGSETVFQLSKHNPQRLIFTGRNAAAADKVIQSAKANNQSLDIEFVLCDFTSLPSVHQAAKHILSTNPHINILICNAGIMAVPPGLTKDGYEVQFGVNHLAHALLIQTLLPVLQDARIVTLTSLGFQFSFSGIEFDKMKTPNSKKLFGAFQRYGQSKLANILYARELAKRYPSITSVSVHPGVIDTGLVSGGAMSKFNTYFTYAATVGQVVSVEDGAKNQLWAATVGKDRIMNGQFYEPIGKVGRTTAQSNDDKLAEKLFQWTENELKSFR